MNNNLTSNTTVNKLYVAHSAKEQKLVQKAVKKYSEEEKVVYTSLEPKFYTGKSYSYDSNGGGYQGL